MAKEKQSQSDLHSYIQDAEAAGKVYRVTKEVDPHRNLAALAEESDRVILFENVAGYEGWTVAANLLGDRDLEAIALKTPRERVLTTLVEGFDKGPREQKIVETGPVKEVIWHGEDANLSRIPVVTHSELDAGPYIGSGIGIVRDPDTGIQNTTFPRMNARDGTRCPFFIFSPHTRQIYMKYGARNEPMPMAMVIGHHPAWEVMAASSLRHTNHAELAYVGSLLGEEADLVRCETIDVDVPARAEMVIEGEVKPGDMADEGPFGNYLGTYSSGPGSVKGVDKGPVFTVKCITMRKNPIFRHLQSNAFTEHQRIYMLPIEASLFSALQEIGVHVHDVFCPSWGGSNMTVVQMTPPFPGEARDALLKILEFENSTLSILSVVAVAVSRDINIYDARDVMYALTIRTNWDKDVVAIPGLRASPLSPAAERVEGSPLRLGSKVMIDATHLPPRDENEEWEYKRARPMGKGSFSLKDFVEEL